MYAAPQSSGRSISGIPLRFGDPVFKPQERGPIAAWKKPLGPHFQPSYAFGRPSMYDYDMVVIGSGPSGRRADVSGFHRQGTDRGIHA
jgi:hypothetical protein